MDSIVSWFVAMMGGSLFAGWVLFKLYEHDFKKHEDKNKYDYWS